jgi:type I restriction enzyme M protein
VVLDLLSRPELQDIADQYQLEVADRRMKDQLVDAAAGSRKVVLVDVLAAYSRDRLKELCRAFGLDDSGKEQLTLVERLVGAKARDSGTYTTVPGSAHVLKARDRAAVYEPLLRRDGISVRRPSRAKERARPRRRTGGHESEAVVSGR